MILLCLPFGTDASPGQLRREWVLCHAGAPRRRIPSGLIRQYVQSGLLYATIGLFGSHRWVLWFTDVVQPIH